MGKNTNKLIITGPADKLNTIRERFRDFGVDYEYAEDEGDKILGTATGGIPQPAVTLNTKERFDAVQPNTRMAPNMVDPAAYPGQALDAGGKPVKDAPVGLGQEPTGTLVETARNNDNAEFNRRVQEEVQKRTSADQTKKALDEKASKKAAGAKQDSPDEDKSDKGTSKRSTK